MGRTGWCELVSGACRLTGGVEEPEGSGHASVLLAEVRGAQNRGRKSVVATVALRGPQFDPCQLECRKHR